MTTRKSFAANALGLLFAAGSVSAHDAVAPGALVAVSVQVDGVTAPLYPARDGSGRRYLEAKATI